MRQAVGYLRTLLKEILFIGFSIQIVFGLVWMCFHFMQIQDFGEPEGFLYPYLLQLFNSVPQVLFLLQLALACFAANLMLKPVCRSGAFWRSWYVLALLTLPMAMQCHVALLPYSFVSSLLFLEVSFCGQAMRGSEGPNVTELAKGAACWLALALLLPEYGWLGGIPLVLVVLFRLPRLRNKLRRFVYCVLVIAAFGGMIAGVNGLTRTEEGYQGSFWFSLASRTTWPTIWNDAYGWPAELRAITESVLGETTYSPGNMERLLQPAIEDAVGVEQAQAYYRLMARQAWQLRKSMIIRQAGWDALVYVLPQVMLPLQLEGEGYDSFSGRNYEIMRRDAPLLTKYYVDYSCWWFVTALAATVLLAATGLIAGERLFPRGTFVFLTVCVLSAGAITIYYVMRGAGISDYKCTLAVSAVWTVWALFHMREEQLNENG